MAARRAEGSPVEEAAHAPPWGLEDCPSPDWTGTCTADSSEHIMMSVEVLT